MQNEEKQVRDQEEQRARPSGDQRRRYKPRFRKKIDRIEAENLDVDYKKPEILRRFMTDQGKILPRRITGTSARNQRRLVLEIKRARVLALLPIHEGRSR